MTKIADERLVSRLRDKTRLRHRHGISGWVIAEERIASDAADRIESLRAEVARLREALDTIAKGMTHRFPGAPDVETAVSPAYFRAAMWAWSQEVARAAIEQEGKA